MQKEEKINETRQIAIETHNITIFRASGKPFGVHCAVCQKRVSAFAVGEISDVLKISVSELKSMREAEEIHAIAENFAGLNKKIAEKK